MPTEQELKDAMDRLHAALNAHNEIMFAESYTPDLTQSIIEQIDEAGREVISWAA